ncbi:ABC-type iron(III)-siderophore transport system, ATPase component [Thermococcus kodakarensis KOD1]|uniref:ABC-type iron(III)-siderophore transport system, ATPase component n=1 Tax=Thermococcus kodakarensis (strain ATCC BAA-918 / JCM 12380 / KOD1) TaxID=69014 RepID=Q5JDD9_THEKO|nr:ABC transporter ATP-binding protein [Thermococcus kodakarensis]WCN27889.1 ABC transporter ATP-binding protein [Thermococcus kodakarensis]WCN30187.1 ABC transporter ATP-binding protein [Thermococcus kodakarensis]BAD86209.1 ABC-type iron(III)-siderophore transport system, ATPase component [Thermococcus kodakarensis KOD1]
MTAVEARNLHYSYNGTEVLKGINLKIEDGEFVAILGPNGAGKSTLLKCLSGILRCNGVYISGRPIGEYSRNELARLVAYIPQRTEPGFMTVFDTVLLGRRPYMGLRPSKRDVEVVKNALKKLGIDHLALRPTRGLSGGELQKVGIARALAQEPEIFMFDEPTNNLDIRSQLEVMKLARELSSGGKTVIMVMHEINLAIRFAERFVFISEGRVVADGGREILKPSLFREVYGTEVEIGEVHGIPVVVPL